MINQIYDYFGRIIEVRFTIFSDYNFQNLLEIFENSRKLSYLQQTLL